MTLKAVFLDIDGTLVDSNEFHVKAWQEAFQKNGWDLRSADIRKQIGKGADNLIPALVPDIDDSHRGAVDEAHGQIFKSRYLHEVKPFKGAQELVKTLHRRHVVTALASSAKRAELHHYVELLGIESYLSAVVTSEDVEQSKPAGDIFAAALAKVAPINAQGSLAVGDTPYDVESALKSGVRSIALRSGSFTDKELMNVGALAIYDNIAAVLGDLDKVFELI